MSKIDIYVKELDFNACGMTGKVVFDEPIYMEVGDRLEFNVKLTTDFNFG